MALPLTDPISLLLALIDVPSVFPIDAAIVQRAKTILLGTRSLSARDALHLAVMQREQVDRILTFDEGFDSFPGVTRISR